MTIYSSAYDRRMMAQVGNSSTSGGHGSVGPVRPRGLLARAAAIAGQQQLFVVPPRSTWTSLTIRWAYHLFFVFGLILAVGIGIIEMSVARRWWSWFTLA